MELSLNSKWLGSGVCPGPYDVLTINSCHVEVICSMSKQKKPDAHIKIELTAEEYMKRAGEEHNRIMEEWEKNRK